MVSVLRAATCRNAREVGIPNDASDTCRVSTLFTALSVRGPARRGDPGATSLLTWINLECAPVAAQRIAPIRPAFGLMGDEDWEVT